MLVVGCERASTTPPPKQKELLAIIALQARGRFEEDAKEYGAIVIGEFDQTGLGNEAAQLDQMARAFAALYDPRPNILARKASFMAMLGRHHAPQRY